MPTYAVLGATGSTGSEIVKNLLDKPDTHLNIYVRNKSKLESAFPGISNSPSATIFTGSISDPSTLTECVRFCDAIFMTVATNTNTPGLSVARTTASSIVYALEKARSETKSTPSKPWVCPRLIWLSSAMLHEPVAKMVPAIGKAMLYRAEWYVYEDSRLASEYLAAEAPWIPVTRACPGAIVKGKKAGSNYGVDANSFTISYVDLADAMVRMAEDEATRGISLGVASLGEPEMNEFYKHNVPTVLKGLLFSYVPGAFVLFDWLGLA